MKPLVFLHGWAQSQQIWCQQHDIFPEALYLNLPGHGDSGDLPSDAWAKALAQQLPLEPCLLVGWSLGGMLTLQITRSFPDRIAALALVSTTPCFRSKSDWQPGCDQSLFAAFEEAVASGSRRLLNRFFTLMLHGDGLSRRDYNMLAKQAVDRKHPPTSEGLSDGLELLESMDLRQFIAKVSVPTLIVHGEQDVVVSTDSGRWLAESMPNSHLHLFQNCGHAPFLTQPEIFNRTLTNWWKTL
ncbi:MAG: alpha/beta fold hydrolase [Mariprofundus sp.]|nr:alpha/beta fold hydrolase [Mariprofundus sp.]